MLQIQRTVLYHYVVACLFVSTSHILIHRAVGSGQCAPRRSDVIQSRRCRIHHYMHTVNFPKQTKPCMRPSAGGSAGHCTPGYRTKQLRELLVTENYRSRADSVRVRLRVALAVAPVQLHAHVRPNQNVTVLHPEFRIPVPCPSMPMHLIPSISWHAGAPRCPAPARLCWPCQRWITPPRMWQTFRRSSHGTCLPARAVPPLAHVLQRSGTPARRVA